MNFLKEIWGKYLSLAMPMRLLITGIISILGGSGILGFLSEYAAYSYSINYGIRPPLEGIPYLKVAITTLTLFLFFGSAAVFLALFGIARLAIHYFYRILNWVLLPLKVAISPIDWILKRMPESRKIFLNEVILVPEPEEMVKKYLVPRSLVEVVSIAIFVGCIVGVFVGYQRNRNTHNLEEAIIGGMAVALLVTVVVILVWRPILVLWLATAGTFVFFVVAPFFLFYAPAYAAVLRLLGYGGGVPVRASLLSDEGALVPAVDGYLVLRTTDALLIYDESGAKILEVPLSSVGSLDYAVTMVGNREWRLPHPRELSVEKD